MRIMRTQLALFWGCVTLATSGVFATNVTLRIFGSHSNDVLITVCPSDSYMFVAECIIVESASFFWTLNPLIDGSVTFSSFNDLGETFNQGVHFVITKQILMENEEQNSYISQIQVHTDLIRQTVLNHGYLKISCGVSAKFESIILNIPGGGTLEINNATIINNKLYVTWSTNVTDIVETVVVARNTNNGIVSSMLVGSKEENFSLPVDPSDPYEVTVTVLNGCRQSFTSKTVRTVKEDILDDRSLSLEHSTAVFVSSKVEKPSSNYAELCTHASFIPGPTTVFVKENQGSSADAGVIALCTVFPVVALIVGVILGVMLVTIIRVKCKGKSAKIASRSGEREISIADLKQPL